MIAKWAGARGRNHGGLLYAQGRTVIWASRDTTLLVWDATLGTSLEPRNLDAITMDRLWNELASDNSWHGNKALWSFVAGCGDGVAYLADKVFVADPEKIERASRASIQSFLRERPIRLRQRWLAMDVGPRAISAGFERQPAKASAQATSIGAETDDGQETGGITARTAPRTPCRGDPGTSRYAGSAACCTCWLPLPSTMTCAKRPRLPSGGSPRASLFLKIVFLIMYTNHTLHRT